MGAGHGHSHGPAHGHALGGAGGGAGANRRAIGAAALLTGGFMVVEAVGGVLANSLALIADAGHMLTDFAALALGWLAFRMAERPADAARTYGFDRWSVLVAFVNGLALFAVAAWIVVEALHRIGAPEPVAGGLMLWIAAAGLAVNVVVFAVLSRGDRENLNLRAALLHVAGDLLGSVAAIVAALVILATGWTPVDPILSTLVALLILRSGWAVVRESGHILLEGAPAGFDAARVRETLRAGVPELAEVRHLHAWSINQERPMITLEAELRPGADGEAARAAIRRILAERFGFDHATIEVCAAAPIPSGASFGDA